MRVFVLEDDPHRLLWFHQRFYQDELTCCSTAADAIKAFKGQWDLVFLDHDLGGETFVDSARDDTGAGFVRACADDLAQCQAVAVHSMNQAGAMRMLAMIGEHAKWIPFPMLQASLPHAD